MNLIIHADDFGMTKSINDAIIELCQLGTLSSTSIMANMPYSKEAIKLLDISNISLGLHSTFTQGKPISEPQKIPSLINKEGLFLSYNELLKNARAGRVDVNHIKSELKAQYSFVKDIIGDRLIFIDAHHSIHNKLKPFQKAFIDVGKELKIPITRTRQQLYIVESKNRIDILRPSLINIGMFGLKKVLTNYYYKNVAKHFSKTFKIADGQLSVFKNDESRIFELVGKLLQQKNNPQSTVYIVSHPATNTNDLVNTNLTEQRVKEYEFLKSEVFTESISIYPLKSFYTLLTKPTK